MSTRRFWGWGIDGEGPTAAQRDGIGATLAERFGAALEPAVDPPTLATITMRSPRASVPPSLAHTDITNPYERAGHTYGKSFRDIVRGLRGDFSAAPDVVVAPRTEDDVVSLLDWCASVDAVAIPYGGGSSVVGGVESGGRGIDDDRTVVTIDLRNLDRVLEIDRVSRAARIQAGVYGPALEDQLRPHGLTLRHFPQSFEFSTLGGWLATRSGGHYATLATHIDDFVEAIRAVTPRGVYESRRLPGSGAGPSPDRLLLGSEGILGVITEAWMRLQNRPVFRSTVAVRFNDFFAGAAAARALAQSGLYPSNCRLLDPVEALITGTEDGTHTVLLVAFESADHPVDAWMARALDIVRANGGDAPEPTVKISTNTAKSNDTGAAPTTVDAWRNAFVRAPYTRDALVQMSVISETFETACTWDRFDELHASVTKAVTSAVRDICGGGWVTCRFTHVYPDGPAPYFTVLAPGRRGSELEQWDDIKAAASDALLSAGGTITHHHAVGRDHRRWYDQQRPALFADALRAAKRALDPSGMLNPGVLIDLG